MDPEPIPEIQKRDSHHSDDDTEHIEKIESDKNSVDIQSSSSNNLQNPKSPDNKDEKFEQMDGAEKQEKPEKDEKMDKNENIEKMDKTEKVETIENIEKEETHDVIEEKKEKDIIEEKPVLNENKEKTEKKPLEEENKKPDILGKMTEKTANLFKASADKKKLEMEIEQKELKKKQKSKKKLISQEDLEILERKKQRFSVVKHWDNERSKALNHQISLVDKLLIRLDQKIRLSNASWNNIIQFFKERIIQESEYVKYSNKMMKLTKTSNGMDPKKKIINDKKEVNVINSSLERFLGEIDDAHDNKAKKLNEFCNYLEKNLIEKLKVEIDNYDKEINAKKRLFENMKKNLSDLNMQTAQKAKIYSKLYFEMINDDEFEINEKKDLFLHELNFVTTARNQSKGIKDLLLEVVKFITTFINLEKKKQEMLKKLFEDYLNRCILAHGSEIYYEVLQKIVLIDENDIDEINSLHSFVTKEDLLFFKHDFDSQENLQKFLEFDFKVNELSNDQTLIKGKFNGFVKSGQVYENSWILFTYDKNLIIIKNINPNEISFENSFLCLRMDGLLVYEKDQKIIELTQNISGLIFNSKKTLMVKVDEDGILSEILKHLNKKI